MSVSGRVLVGLGPHMRCSVAGYLRTASSGSIVWGSFEVKPVELDALVPFVMVTGSVSTG